MIGASVGLTVLETLRAAGNVGRFHNEPARIQQNNAEHTWHVMTLVLMVEPDATARLLRAVHMHDMGEIFTGDFPAPLKWDYPEIKPILREAENRGLLLIGWTMPTLTAYEESLLKWCDGAELCLTAYEHAKRGNRMALRPFRLVLPRLARMLECDATLRSNERVVHLYHQLERYLDEVESKR